MNGTTLVTTLSKALAAMGGRNAVVYGAIAVLVILGLLLPPISLLERVGLSCAGVDLNANSPAVTTEDGLTVALSNPDQAVRIRLSSVDAAEFEAGQAGDDLQAALQALPVSLILESPIYQINSCSSDAQAASVAVKIQGDVQSANTLDLSAWDGKQWSWLGAYLDPVNETVYVQVAAMPKIMALFQTASVAPYVGAQVKPGQTLSGDAANLLNEVYVPGWMITDGGSITAVAGTLPTADSARFFPVVRNVGLDGTVNASLVSTMLASDETQQAHIQALTNLAGRSTFSGVAIDYRGLTSTDRAAFTSFIRQLATVLQAENKLLAVVLPAPSIDANGAPDTTGYDWPAIGAAADIVQSDLGQDPASYLSGGVAYALLDWAPTQINRYKFEPILSVASLDTANGQTTEMSYMDAIKPLGELKLSQPMTVTAGEAVTLTLDNPEQVSDYHIEDSTHTHRFTYMSSGTQHAVVVNTAASLGQQLNLLLPRHMRGVVVTGLSNEDVSSDFAQVLTGYRQQSIAADVPSSLQVAWSISSKTGQQVLKADRPITDTTVIWKTPADPGSFSVAASIASQSRGSGVIDVAAVITDSVAAGDTTTTTVAGASTSACYSAAFVTDVTIPDGTKLKNGETFTKTWRIRNDGTCDWPEDTVLVFTQGSKLGTPDTVQVGKVVTGTRVDISVQLTSPDQYGNYTGIWQLHSSEGNFGTLMSAVIQAGEPPPGSVVAAAPAPSAARPIGNIGNFEIGGQIDSFRRPDLMKKAGMSWIKVQSGGGDESDIINRALAQGFKILLSVRGDPGSVMDPNYQNSYSADVARMGAAGADAIEVWNEPNIDREWPHGQINGANYTALLAQAYPAIKAANPNTLVISAAPAPTGFWGAAGCGADGSGCNDDVFLQQMAAAGAANYMDCVGAHHNSGTTAPSVTSGRPEGNHYSWYFLPTLNLYYNAFGGARKVCFTELGYLSPEGYPSLASTAPNFAWAENTTVAEQAQWLAQAASISASSGKVRLMIVFNVDFTYYGSDPQAGYAIIRPGDSCPACDALGAVVGSR